VKIKYVNHSGFILEFETFLLMIDCCGLTKENAEVSEAAGKHLYILASHVHYDHFDPNIISFGDVARDVRTHKGHFAAAGASSRHPCRGAERDVHAAEQKWILSEDIREALSHLSQNKDIHFLAKGELYRDKRVLIKAFGSTDEGVSFYIEAGGKKIFHAGDLNNWHWKEEETPEDAAKNEQAFLDELAVIAKEAPVLDAAMFPVDPRLGRDYSRGAEQFLDKIKVGLFLPMHFGNNFEAARAFKPAAEQRGCCFADIRAAGDEFSV